MHELHCVRVEHMILVAPAPTPSLRLCFWRAFFEKAPGCFCRAFFEKAQKRLVVFGALFLKKRKSAWLFLARFF